MSTMAYGHSQPTHDPTLRLDPDILANLTSVRDELHRRANAGLLPGRGSFGDLFADVFGGNVPRLEQIRILFFAAPLVRRIVHPKPATTATSSPAKLPSVVSTSIDTYIASILPLCPHRIQCGSSVRGLGADSWRTRQTTACGGRGFAEPHPAESASCRAAAFATSWLRTSGSARESEVSMRSSRSSDVTR